MESLKEYNDLLNQQCCCNIEPIKGVYQLVIKRSCYQCTEEILKQIQNDALETAANKANFWKNQYFHEERISIKSGGVGRAMKEKALMAETIEEEIRELKHE